MASFAKFKATQVVGLLIHNDRDGTDEHTHSNKNIDPTRTQDNYQLREGEGTAYERYKQRMSEVRCMKRDDVTTLDSMVITLPKDVRPEDERKFFEGVYAFMCGDVGEQNVISAMVHKDEKSPHLHFDFIPVVHGKDRKGNEVEKVCHCRLITMTYLKTFHTRLNEFMADYLGYEVGILNGATANGNKTVEELKAEQLQQENEAMRAENEQLRQENAQLRAELLDYEPPKRKLFESKEKYEKQTKTAQQAKAVKQKEAQLDRREATISEREALHTQMTNTIAEQKRRIESLTEANNDMSRQYDKLSDMLTAEQTEKKALKEANRQNSTKLDIYRQRHGEAEYQEVEKLAKKNISRQQGR